MRNKFGGVSTALITPFAADGSVDYTTLAAIIEEQIGHGINGLIPCGSTGEAATLSHEEHADIFRFVVKQANGRALVIAGTGSNNTAEAIELTKQAQDAGADAALLITPYYNKPTQEGLLRHFTAIADSTELPLFLYDIPGRTAVKISHSVLQTLADHPRIIGLKDATGSLVNTAEVRRLTPPDFVILSGDDALTLPMMAVGADGVISVSSHLVAGQMIEMARLFRASDLEAARKIHESLLPLMDVLFVETNPTPIKLALKLTGRLPVATPRLPLVEPSAASEAMLTEVLRACGLL